MIRPITIHNSTSTYEKFPTFASWAAHNITTMTNTTALDISIYAVDTKYWLDSKSSVAVKCVNIPTLISYLKLRYDITPKSVINEKWSVELFNEGKWIKTIRTYYRAKSIRDFDLYFIPDKRRHAKLIEVTTAYETNT